MPDSKKKVKKTKEKTVKSPHRSEEEGEGEEAIQATQLSEANTPTKVKRPANDDVTPSTPSKRLFM